MKQKRLRDRCEEGFTLVELLVAMAISGIVIIGIYTIQSSQQKSYALQEQITVTQQNLRAAMYFITSDVRMAGCDPMDTGAGVTTANANSLTFSMHDGVDNDADGSIDELDELDVTTYSLVGSDFVRNIGGGNQVIAEDIDALDFVYLGPIAFLSDLIDNDGDGAVDEADENVLPFPVNILNIRIVQITFVARANRRDRSYVNTQVYRNQQGAIIFPAPNDNFRRTVLSTEVKCRNLGI